MLVTPRVSMSRKAAPMREQRQSKPRPRARRRTPAARPAGPRQGLKPSTIRVAPGKNPGPDVEKRPVLARRQRPLKRCLGLSRVRFAISAASKTAPSRGTTKVIVVECSGAVRKPGAHGRLARVHRPVRAAQKTTGRRCTRSGERQVPARPHVLPRGPDAFLRVHISCPGGRVDIAELSHASPAAS